MKTLAIDIGGTGLKASVLDEQGNMLVKRVRVATPHPSAPDDVLPALEGIVKQLPEFDRISAGFPGVVRGGRIITAPNLGTKAWRDFPLQDELTKRFGKPARVENDAEVQGLGVITGKGLEVVVTLGTGIGSAIFHDGQMTPASRTRPPSDPQVRDLRRVSRRRHAQGDRQEEVERACCEDDRHPETRCSTTTRSIWVAETRRTSPSTCRPNVKLASNEKGITGGIHLWDKRP